MALQRALTAAQTAEDNRGIDIVVLDMRELTSIFDYFVLASGASRRQLHAMSEEIDHALEDRMGDRRLGIEGYEESRWILLDYGDVVVHLFEPETRAYARWKISGAEPSACIAPTALRNPTAALVVQASRLHLLGRRDACTTTTKTCGVLRPPLVE